MKRTIKNPLRQNQSGFSLVELLVVTAMLGLIVTAIYNVFNNQGRISRAQQSILEMQSNGRAVINYLSQSFAHAGFGTSETNSQFLDFTNGTFDDIVIIRYGYRDIGTVTTNATQTSTISYTPTISDYSAINAVSFFPSTTPNNEFSASAGATQITIGKDVGFVPANAKIYQVGDITFKLNTDGELERVAGGDTEKIAKNVVCFKMAYSTKNPAEWKTDNDSSVKPKAIYIYLVFRTENKEPGFNQGNNFKIPWETDKLAPITPEDGYHYQDFQAMVWVRNAN